MLNVKYSLVKNGETINKNIVINNSESLKELVNEMGREEFYGVVDVKEVEKDKSMIDESELIEDVKARDKIPAIKMVWEKTGWDLLRSKKFVEGVKSE